MNMYKYTRLIHVATLSLQVHLCHRRHFALLCLPFCIDLIFCNKMVRKWHRHNALRCLSLYAPCAYVLMCDIMCGACRTYRSMCRSFLFPTSIIGTLHEKGKNSTLSFMHHMLYHTHLGVCLDRKTRTYWTFPTMSNSFSWITCTTSKLEENKAKFLLQHTEISTYMLFGGCGG